MKPARLRCLAFISLSAVTLWSKPNLATESDPQGAPVLSYSVAQKPRYLRLAIEELAVLGAGLGQYWYNRGSNSRDWQFNYDWPSLRDRLEGKAYAFDTNGFDTNFFLHPISGTLYYLTARSNHLGPFESLAVAFGSSFLWEFAGEFQEKLSVNDILVTPLAGMAWGETTTQLGALFFRACPSTRNEILGSTFAPFTALHDAVDGATRLHSDCGEGNNSTHRFRLSLSGGEAWTEGLSPYPEVTAALRTEVIHLPGFDRPGNGHATFSDGNVSRLEFSLALAEPRSADITDVTLLTQTVVAGLHYRNNYFSHGELRRREAIFGFMIGAEYSRHRYDPQGPADRIFLLDLPGFTTRYYGHSSGIGWELTLNAGGSFGAADSFALSRAERQLPAPELTSVAQSEGYNHVAGVTLNPRARLELGPTEIGLDFRGDRLLAFRALDRAGYRAHTPISEFRRKGSLWLSFGAPWVARFLLSVNWMQRSGAVGDVHVRRNELSLNAGVELSP